MMYLFKDYMIYFWK